MAGSPCYLGFIFDENILNVSTDSYMWSTSNHRYECIFDDGETYLFTVVLKEGYKLNTAVSEWYPINIEGNTFSITADAGGIDDLITLTSIAIEEEVSPTKIVDLESLKNYNTKLNEKLESNYVKNTDYASADKGGIMKINGVYGISHYHNGYFGITEPSNEDIENKTTYRPITVKTLDYAIKVGLTTNTIELTEEEKAKVHSWLGIPHVVHIGE